MIEPGSFKMGDTVGDGLPRENPIQEVVISSIFTQRPSYQMHWEAKWLQSLNFKRDGVLFLIRFAYIFDAIDFISKLTSHIMTNHDFRHGVYASVGTEWSMKKIYNHTKWCWVILMPSSLTS